MLDLDELTGAVAAGLLDPVTAERALRTSHRTLAGLAARGHHLDAWLATHDVVLTWY